MKALVKLATLCGVLLLSGVSVMAHAANLLPRVIPANTTVKCAGISVEGDINYDGVPTSGTYKNTMPIIDMRNGSTLEMTNTWVGTYKHATLFVGLIVTNGPVNLVIDRYWDGTEKEPELRRHVIIRNSGVLSLPNSTGATFGCTELPANYHFYDVKNVTLASGGKITFSHARVLNFPSATSASWQADDQNEPCLYLANPDDMFGGTNDFTITEMYGPRLVVQTEGAVQSHTTITIPDNYSFGVMPAASFDISVQNMVNTSTNVLDDAALTRKSPFTFQGNIKFDSALSVVSNDVPYATSLSFTGTITGNGTAFTHTHSGDYATGNVTTHSFSDVDGFTGIWGVSSDSTEPLCQMVVGANRTFKNGTIAIGAGGGVVGASGVSYAQAGDVIGKEVRDAVIQVQANQMITVESSAGAFATKGEGADTSTLNIIRCAEPTVLSNDGSVQVLMDGAEPTVGAQAAAYDKSFTCYALPDATGKVDVRSLQSAMVSHPYLSITANSGSVLTGISGATTISSPDASDVSVDADGGVDLTLRGEGTTRLLDSTAEEGSWTNAVTYWFDFNRQDSIRYPTEMSPYLPTPREVVPELQAATRKFKLTASSSARDYKLVSACVDWRHPDSPNRLWHAYWEKTTDTADHRKSYTNNYLGVYALKAISRTRSFVAIDKGAARSLPFQTNASPSSDGSSAEVAEIIMVFGSQDGGGHALVATEEAAFGRRNELTCPFLTNNLHGVTMRVNGEEIDPETTPPNGAWQVLTLGMGDKNFHFKGLGFLRHYTSSGEGSWGSHNGGQRYGEILIFKEKPDEITRLEAEMYLANKWKTDYPNKAAALAWIAETRRTSVTNRVTVSGSGTIVGAGRTLELSGDFSGRVELNGDKISITERTSAYTEDQIPSENRVWWSDPCVTSTVKTVIYRTLKDTTYGHTNAVRALCDRSVGEYVVGDKFLLGSAGREPYLVEQAHGFGPKLPWLDFYEYSFSKPANTNELGNCLRFNKLTKGYNFEKGADSTRFKFDIQTAFIVQDLSRSGIGNPLLDNIYGTGKITTRTVSRTDPIWPGSQVYFQQGETRLNGRVVNQADGVTALPELLTLRATNPYGRLAAGWFLGYYGTSERDTTQRLYGEMLGEVLLYSSTLTDEQVLGIEGYLMKKWLGTQPPGIADLTKATFSGTGELTVADDTMLPEIADTFAGTLTVSSDTLTRTVLINPETDVVSGAFNAPDATFDLPAHCTLNVDFSSKLEGSIEKRRYVLVNCTKYVTPVEPPEARWTINLGPTVPLAWAHIEHVDGSNLYELVVDPAGFMIMVK